MTNKERLEQIKKVHMERIKQNEFYTASFIHVEWLIEQAEMLNKVRELINDERITKSETVDKISNILNA